MALKTNILSAIGSRNFPKFVTILRSRANFPSMWSVRDATAKIANAHIVEYGISLHSINRTKNGTSTIRNTVSLFAVFISSVSLISPYCLANTKVTISITASTINVIAMKFHITTVEVKGLLIIMTAATKVRIAPISATNQ